MAGNHLSKRNEKGQYVQHYDWDEVLPPILDRLADGESLASIIAEPDTPSRPKLFQILFSPEWVDKYQAATGGRAELIGYNLEQVAEDVATGKLDAAKGRVIAEILSKRMGQLAPRKFNDKVVQQVINHTVTHKVDIRDKLLRAEKRLLDAEGVDTDSAVEGVYKVVSDDDAGDDQTS